MPSRKKEVIRGIVVLLIFLLLYVLSSLGPEYTGSAVSDINTIELKLDKNETGESEHLTGVLELSGKFSKDAKIRFFIDDKNVFDGSLKDYFDVRAIQESYKETGFSSSTSLSFVGEETKTELALKLPQSAEILSASFDVVGANAKEPKIDLGNDGSFEWQYIGDFIRYDDRMILPEGATRLTADKSVFINGREASEYCEEIELPSANKFKVSGYVKSLDNNAILHARLRDERYSDLKTDCEIKSTNTFDWSSCELNTTNKAIQRYLVCLYATSGSSTIAAFELGVVDNNKHVSGHFCSYGSCSISPLDYLIVSYKGLYQLVLNTKDSFSGIELLDAIENYLGNYIKCPLGEYCLIPITVDSIGGSIVLENLNVEYTYPGGFPKLTTFSLISFTPEELEINESINLDDFNLVAGAKGEHKLKVWIDDISKEILFSVVETPIADISVGDMNINYGDEVSFDGGQSRGIKGKIIAYSWDFGDGQKASGAIVKHKFNGLGEFKVVLTVTDENGLSGSGNTVVKIGSLSTGVDTIILEAKNVIDDSINYLSIGERKDISEDLRYLVLLESFKANLTKYETQVKAIKESTILNDSEKETELRKIVDDILVIEEKIPVAIGVNILEYKQSIDYGDLQELNVKVLVDAKNAKDEEQYRGLIFEYQNGIDVSNVVKELNIRFFNGGNEKIFLVDKKISSTKTISEIIELIPKSLLYNFGDIELISSGAVLDNILKFSGDEAKYIIKNNEIGIKDLLKIKTLAIPDLARINIQKVIPVCGDGKCHYNAEFLVNEADLTNRYYCKEDCEKGINWILVIVLVAIGILGVYYINFYKGKYNFQELITLISAKKKKLFASKQDLINLMGYITKSLEKGFKREEVRRTLFSKGWTKEQIDYAFKELEKPKGSVLGFLKRR